MRFRSHVWARNPGFPWYFEGSEAQLIRLLSNYHPGAEEPIWGSEMIYRNLGKDPDGYHFQILLDGQLHDGAAYEIVLGWANERPILIKEDVLK